MVAEADIFKILEEVKDPEIPLLSVVDMGIVRGVDTSGDSLSVTITPTYSGCPAMKMIEDDIVSALNIKGFPNAEVKVVLDPPWTTDWLTEHGRVMLKQSGIAAPGCQKEDQLVNFPKRETIECPFCDSRDTSLQSEFGSTACKALYKCHSCGMPFDYFKAI